MRSVFPGMTNTLQRGASAAVIGLAVLAGACSANQSSTTTPPTTSTSTSTSEDRKASGGQAPTSENLPEFKKLADCMREQDVDAPEPAVGTPYDTSSMDELFSNDRAKWDKALTACPDYKRLVIGVG